jgi:pyrroline-5-carboxylate reductase
MSVDLSILKGKSLGLIGAGNMAEAIVRGVLGAGALSAEKIIANDVSAARRDLFANTLKVRLAANNREVVEFSDIVLLAIKPQQVDAVLDEIGQAIRPQTQILVSICAGVTTARLEKKLPEGARVVRVMPNTPMLVGLGASCLCGGAKAAAADVAAVEAIFAGASLTLRVKETMMDAVTGLSGSGPAYLFYLAEAMVEAGVAENFSRGEAQALTTRTLLGAARLLEETKLPPEELRRRVTSPKGTTQAALEYLESEGVKAKLTAAVRRAAARSRELS